MVISSKVCIVAVSNILSVYSPFSDRIGLPLHNTPFPGVNEEYWSSVFRPDALPDVNHMCEIQMNPVCVVCVVTSD